MKQIQTRLGKKPTKPIPNTTWGKPQYIKVIGNRQRIELSRGCPHNCPFCYEPTELEVFPIPRIVRNYVEILDMNFLYQPNIIERIHQLGEIRVNDKVVYYEAVCGFDFRLLTQEIANALKKARFIKPRMAWDWFLKDQYKIKDAINMLLKAGYKRRDISLFMIVNWKIPKEECERKLDLMKVWNIKVCDCCYDGGYRYAIPEHWTKQELIEFRAKCRKHNQLVNFGIDPEIKSMEVKNGRNEI